MSAGLVLAGVLKGIETLSYVYGEREGSNGLVKSGTERVSPFSPKQIFGKILMNQISLLFNTFQFTAVQELLNKSSRNHHPSQQKEFELILELSKAHDYWDKFQIEKARIAFHQISKQLRKNDNQEKLKIKQYLYKVNTWLAHVEKDKNYVTWDIFLNAERRAQEGKFDDAVARLYRAIEMLLQIEYKKEFNKETEEGLLKTLEKLRTKKGNKTIQRFEDLENDLKKLLNTRNQSILAHGLQPITEEKFKKMRDIAEKLILPSKKIDFIKLE